MTDYLENRHVGINAHDENHMLAAIGIDSLDSLISKIIPDNIRLSAPLDLPQAMSESEYLEHITALSMLNTTAHNFIGQGWYGTHMPAAIRRNILENPAWYTSYTPYQAEISQGRLEALFVFQTAVSDLTGLPLANCSMLDEATAAAEAATMMRNLRTKEQVNNGANRLLADKNIFPPTLEVLRTRCAGQGIQLVIDDAHSHYIDSTYFGVILQYPDSNGLIHDYSAVIENAHANNAKVTLIADIMALTLLPSPGQLNADIAVGTTQRWGIPMGYGGPAAAYMACRDEYKREIPGRIIGLSRDQYGKPAYRLALQTREQHIKREKATSNLCTSQALMAIMAAMYTVYHGKDGISSIAKSVHGKATYINELLPVYGFTQLNETFFDTLHIQLPEQVNTKEFRHLAQKLKVNLYHSDDRHFLMSVDEATTVDDINAFIELIAQSIGNNPIFADGSENFELLSTLDDENMRRDNFLTAHVFEAYRTETELMRYIKRLERRDISLVHSMISLGSCTMKLNPATAMMPITLPGFANIHPLAPHSQTRGYNEMLSQLQSMLCAITGFDAACLQPTSGAAGEYAGLVVIRKKLKRDGMSQRNIMLIPASAHGTNPASAVQAGFTPLVVKCDQYGNTDIDDWKQKAEQNADKLAGCMITYPSTHGIFEHDVRLMCDIIHHCGGWVYMDGANMNAQVGLTHPAAITADVCHLNFHKTFASPHGGGGPGAGAICVSKALKDCLPTATDNRVSSALYGNAGIAVICHAYITLMGERGLTRATKAAILNANYLAAKLKDAYGIVYTGQTGFVGHELILDCRQFKQYGITENDIAKRLMDFGYHAPTLSFPVHGTLMVEPTESESISELDRFIDAMLTIRAEIQDIQDGKTPADDNPLVNAPHPEYLAAEQQWQHPYSRQQAFFPAQWVADSKFWLPVARVDNGYGDRNLVAKIL